MAETWMRLWGALWPGLVVMGGLGVALGWFVWGPRGGRAGVDRREGSVLLPAVLLHFGYWLARPIVAALDRPWLVPNHITLASLVPAAAAGALLGGGAWMAGAWVLVFAAVFDLFDGLLARRRGAGSAGGAFLDSFVDRITEALVLGGLAVHGAGGPLTWACVWALVASLLVSYARARGQSLGVDPKVGLMQRPERLLLLFGVLFATPIVEILVGPTAGGWVAVVGLAMLAGLSTATAVRRAWWAVGRLGTGAPGQHEKAAAAESRPDQRDAPVGEAGDGRAVGRGSGGPGPRARGVGS